MSRRKDLESLTIALQRVRDLLAAEAWARTRRLSQAVDLLTVLIEDGPARTGRRAGKARRPRQ